MHAGILNQLIIYTASGLVKEVRTEAGLLLTTYTYDGRGARICKTDHDASGAVVLHVWYVYDPTGGLLGTYEQQPAAVSAEQVEVPIGGSSRIGVLYRQVVSNTSIYELTDHLGNVRATFRRDATLEEWTDYDAWGTPLEGRRQVSSI